MFSIGFIQPVEYRFHLAYHAGATVPDAPSARPNPFDKNYPRAACRVVINEKKFDFSSSLTYFSCVDYFHYWMETLYVVGDDDDSISILPISIPRNDLLGDIDWLVIRKKSNRLMVYLGQANFSGYLDFYGLDFSLDHCLACAREKKEHLDKEYMLLGMCDYGELSICL